METKQIEGESCQLSKDEIAEDWLVEAQRRARELDEGIVQPVSADEVRHKAQALLR